MKRQDATAATQRLSAPAILLDWLAVILFFAGVALIAVGLWCIWPPIALIFSGFAAIYLAMCINKTAKSPVKDG